MGIFEKLKLSDTKQTSISLFDDHMPAVVSDKIMYEFHLQLDQFKQINSLRCVVENKERKIQHLETRLAVMSCSNTPLSGTPISQRDWVA